MAEVSGERAAGRLARVSEGDVEYVLTLVLRVEKAERPGQTDALETAARAVLSILADERSAGDGEWADAMRAWQDARIRKVVRRARGAEWRRAAALPGITVSGTGAPGPDASATAAGEGCLRWCGAPPVWVPLLRFGCFRRCRWMLCRRSWPSCRSTGTDLEDPEPPAAPDPATPVLWVNPGLTMSTGKTMAQCGHGAHLAWLELTDNGRKSWQADNFALAVRTATPSQWKSLLGSGLPVVQDAGFTEIDPGSYTVVADHPAFAASRLSGRGSAGG